MKLSITNEAAQWYKEEMNLRDGDSLQFFVQLYGQSVHPNYSLGIARNEKPLNISYHSIVEGINFYIGEEDKWFFEDYHVSVTIFNNEVTYDFKPL
ncbi:HesB/YadR/YfhF family protein [Bacillus carboniphilus]|uniref:HesB/YadR/YfhF family protein n=1 Tax=Bacillus carboniphilus TaxID=86663 RepID=A0ABN0W4K7_9BACI